MRLDDKNLDDITSFCTSALHECLTKDKPEMLETYLWLYNMRRNFEQGTATGRQVWHLRVVLAHYATMAKKLFKDMLASKSGDLSLDGQLQDKEAAEKSLAKLERSFHEQQSKNLVEKSFLSHVTDYLDSIYDLNSTLPPSEALKDLKLKLKAYIDPLESNTGARMHPSLGAFLVYKGIPDAKKLLSVISTLKLHLENNKSEEIALVLTHLSEPSVNMTTIRDIASLLH